MLMIIARGDGAAVVVMCLRTSEEKRNRKQLIVSRASSFQKGISIVHVNSTFAWKLQYLSYASIFCVVS